jgi:hypothetical protein
VYPRKERPENKIDGAVALIMALGRHMVFEEEPSLDEFLKNAVMVWKWRQLASNCAFAASSVALSTKLLPDPVALDFVQIKLDRRGIARSSRFVFLMLAGALFEKVAFVRLALMLMDRSPPSKDDQSARTSEHSPQQIASRCPSDRDRSVACRLFGFQTRACHCAFRHHASEFCVQKIDRGRRNPIPALELPQTVAGIAEATSDA